MNIKQSIRTDPSPPCRSSGLSAWIAIGLLVFVTPVSAQSMESQAAPAPPTDPVDSIDCSEATGEASGGRCCGRRGRGKGRDSDSSHSGCRGGGEGRGAGAGKGSRGGHGGRPEMQLAHFLIDHHQSLERTVEMTPNGVRTRTTTSDPELIEPLREHVRQMAALLHDGGHIRRWDPLFREIFERRESIEMEIRELEAGVEVIETSTEEDVVLLIQAHAEKVDEFVARGRAAYREETPLPAGYADSSP